jgi:hypothetical protein
VGGRGGGVGGSEAGGEDWTEVIFIGFGGSGGTVGLWLVLLLP